MTQKVARIGWIGLGKMGAPICRRLRAAGYSVTAHVRSEFSRNRAKSLEIPHVGEIGELVAGSDIVMAAISDDRALEEIVSGSAGLAALMRPGQVFVDLSTVSPDASQRVAAQLDERRVDYLRAPVSGSTATAETGQLTVLASGPKGVFDRLAPVFEAFASKRFHVGDAEQARYLKLALNAMVGATSALVAEALTFGRKGGLDTGAMLEVIGNSVVASPLINYKRAMLASGNFAPAFTVSQMMKDLDIVLSVGRTGHCPLPLTSQIRQQFETAFISGQGDKDFFVLFEDYARMAGIGDMTKRQ